jgi:hypothetical protein
VSDRDLIPLKDRTEEERQIIMVAWRLGLELELNRNCRADRWTERPTPNQPPNRDFAYRIKRRE